MGTIAKILPLNNVLVSLDASSKKRVLEQVGVIFESNNRIARHTVFDSLFAREKLGSTGLGEGIAIPHGRIKGLRDTVGAFIKLKAPVPYDAPDGKPVQLLFVLLVPERATDLHLQILGELAQIFSDKTLRARLLECDETVRIHELLVNYTPNAPDQRSAAV
jgi:PTS system nitrogen regulatory IIA component